MKNIDLDFTIFRKFAVGLLPFLIIWTAFGFANFFGFFGDYHWWSIPYMITWAALFVGSMMLAAKEFGWE